jgi:hypothetical protein
MNDEKKAMMLAAREAIKNYIQEHQTWNQEASYLVIEKVFTTMHGEKPEGLRDAIWEILNASAFRQKCEKLNLIPKSNGRGAAKVDSVLANLGL